MGYQLGVDIGTTHTAAAVLRQGQAEMAILGDDTATLPSVIFVGTDDAVVVGDAARELGFSDPTRVARAFIRRLGDPVPLVLGETPYSPDDLMAKLLRRVIDVVSEREGAFPDLVTVSHPANWGAYRLDLLNQVIGLAGMEGVRTVSDPEAAAIFYCATEGIPDGKLVVVYDLGGGTFDAAVGRKTPDGFEIVGAAEGIDRLGGIDFDEAVLAHISRAVGVGLADFEPDDPATTAAIDGLREECAVLKETLSTAAEVSVPVFLPGGEREVRVTRDELDAMVRSSLTETVEVLRRTLVAADVDAAEVDSVVLVGGSSRMPLVAQLVSEELGRPVTVAAEPTHAVALGAALSMVSWAEKHDPPPSPPKVSTTLTESTDSESTDSESTDSDSAESKDAESKDAESKDAESKDAESKDAESKDADSKDADSDSAESKDAGSKPAEQASPQRSGPPPLSLLMSIVAAACSLVMVAAAAGAGTLIAVGQVAAGIGLVALAVGAGVALLLIMRRPAHRVSATTESAEHREESPL